MVGQKKKEAKKVSPRQGKKRQKMQHGSRYSCGIATLAYSQVELVCKVRSVHTHIILEYFLVFNTSYTVYYYYFTVSQADTSSARVICNDYDVVIFTVLSTTASLHFLLFHPSFHLFVSRFFLPNVCS